ncbi:MAG: glycosyltransferase family A protein [Mycobacteriales bacterium]|nr:glycosyltransferase family A protein [Mycobacteriales bacterium]
MTPTPPLLSIVVPTFNRARFLEEALGELTAQWAALAADDRAAVDVVVVDNGSEDTTPEVTARFARAGALRVVRRPVNIGPSNTWRCTEYAEGDFVLIHSDDDVLLPDGLSTIVTALRSHPDVDALSPNIRDFATELFDGSVAFARSADARRSAADLHVELGSLITYISALVYRRSLVADLPYEEVYETYLPHSYGFVDILSLGTTFLALARPCIGYRNDNAGPYDYVHVFLDQYFRLLARAQSRGLPADDVAEIRRAHLRRHVVPMLVRVKAQGAFGEAFVDWPAARRRLREHYSGSDRALCELLALLTRTPAPVVRGVLAARKALRPRGSEPVAAREHP